MKIFRDGVAVGALALAVALTAAAAQDRPESILPPGFNDPVAPAPTPTPTAAPGVPATVQPIPVPVAAVTPTPTPTPSATPTPIDLSAYELPDSARRSLDRVGVVGADTGGLSSGAFANSDGPMVERLMRRLDAPIPSRWLSIALRRALVSRLDTPPRVNGADFAAERAWLLLRMGEADAARAVVQSVDVADYTPKLFQVAMQAMLATGDPSGMCPLVEPALAITNETGWLFARSMCAALGGKGPQANQLLRTASRRTGRSIDALLAEKVVGAAGGARAVTIEWAGVDRLTAWRLGLAMATGVEVPAELLAQGRPWVAHWRATSPMIAPDVRASLADRAAAQGVLSNLALVDLYSEVESLDDAGSPVGAAARDLRGAFTEKTQAARLRLLQGLWNGGGDARGRYGRLVLTARAASRMTPSADLAGDAPTLIASMLTAGLDRPALRWSRVVPEASDGWAMLALADPRGRSVTAAQVNAYRDGDASAGRMKARMALAGLTGLGRLSADEAQSLAQPFDVRFGAENSWTRAIDAAARAGDGGTVLLLMAIGMQTADWRGVPPEVLYHGTAALRRVGLGGEARMIAAEAIARL